MTTSVHLGHRNVHSYFASLLLFHLVVQVDFLYHLQLDIHIWSQILRNKRNQSCLSSVMALEEAQGDLVIMPTGQQHFLYSILMVGLSLVEGKVFASLPLGYWC